MVPGMFSGGNSSRPGTRTTPRSISFSEPPPSRITLSGLMSRWMMPARCSAATARASVIAILRPSSNPSAGAARQPRFQKLALIERHDRVEAGLAPRRQLDDAPDPGVVHAGADPGLADERRVVGLDAGDLGLGKFQGDIAALDLVLRGEQPAVAAVGDQRPQAESVDRLAAQAAPGSPAIAGSRR